MFLYIGENINKIRTGGDAINSRNIKALQIIFGKEFRLINVSCTSKIKTFISLLLGFMNGLTIRNSYSIVNLLVNKTDSTVFLSSSKMGKLAAIIKQRYPQIKIIVFFHNIEKQYANEEYRVNHTLKNWFISKITAYNEYLATRYGDTFIVLNERDKKLLYQHYNLNAHIILPTSFEDKYNVKKRNEIKINKDNTYLSLLFVGSAFFANVEAINWFIQNVFSHLTNCRLIIVGNGMDNKFHSSENIHVYGYVEDLSTYYYNCDIVISPILSGGGMKTKTAEALMYGCPIIGTKESFEGYDIDFEKVGACCLDSDSMITSIKKFQNNLLLLENCAKYARYIYKQKYIFSASLEILNKLNTQ